MRVISGIAKGRKLATPKGGALRITADRIKESLFDILGSLDGSIFLDLYAGSGNVGIEALSRGAERCVFIENRRTHAAQIEKNLSLTGLSGGKVIVLSVQKALKQLHERKERFDIIFADPPYRQGMVAPTIRMISQGRLLSTLGIVVIEHSALESCEGERELSIYDQRRYGDTIITFLTTSE